MNEDKLLTKYEVMDYLNISRRHFEKFCDFLSFKVSEPYLLIEIDNQHQSRLKVYKQSYQTFTT